MRRLLLTLVLTGLALFTWHSQIRAEDAPAKIKVLLITGDDVGCAPLERNHGSR